VAICNMWPFVNYKWPHRPYLKISDNKSRCSEKLLIFGRCSQSSSPLYSENWYKLHMLRKHTSFASFLPGTIKAHIHSVTHAQLRKLQHPVSRAAYLPEIALKLEF